MFILFKYSLTLQYCFTMSVCDMIYYEEPINTIQIRIYHSNLMIICILCLLEAGTDHEAKQCIICLLKAGTDHEAKQCFECLLKAGTDCQAKQCLVCLFEAGTDRQAKQCIVRT